MIELLALETPPFTYPAGDWFNAFPVFGGFAAVQREANGRWSLVDESGATVGDATYARSGPFWDGMLIVREESGWGAVEPGGRIAVAPKLQDIDVFSEGLVPAKLKGKWGFMDRNGAWAIPPAFQDALPMTEGLAPVKAGKAWGYIDRSGALVIEATFKRAFCFRAGHAQVVSTGAELRSRVLREYKKDAAATEFKGKWGTIDTAGKYVIVPRFEYQESEFQGVGTEEDASLTPIPFHAVRRRVHGAARFANGLAPVRSKMLWGYCDESGQVVIEPQYGWAKPFGADGKAKVYRWLAEPNGRGKVETISWTKGGGPNE